jgi:hypothetical protein
MNLINTLKQRLAWPKNNQMPIIVKIFSALALINCYILLVLSVITVPFILFFPRSIITLIIFILGLVITILIYQALILGQRWIHIIYAIIYLSLASYSTYLLFSGGISVVQYLLPLVLPYLLIYILICFFWLRKDVRHYFYTKNKGEKNE